MKTFARLVSVFSNMKASKTGFGGKPFTTRLMLACCVGWLACSLGVFALPGAAEASTAQTGELFATPEDAVSALARAVASQSLADLRSIFGPDSENLENPDRVQATNDWEEFTEAYNAGKRIVQESSAKAVLVVGTNSWPFPVPLVKTNGHWFWDAVEGEDEILNRRIGENELNVLQSMRAYVDAQREYASKYRNNSDVLQFAQKLASTPGKQDGLYWPPDQDGQLSPLGPLVADATEAGYNLGSRSQDTQRAPFHGYYFKILTRQGNHAAGGQYDYVINGNMIAGFGLVAWPADYGNSGIMTFMVNQQGRVYQQDLGPKTDTIAPAITTFDPGPGWTLSPD